VAFQSVSESEEQEPLLFDEGLLEKAWPISLFRVRSFAGKEERFSLDD
jgi:hypothetical protein